MALYYFHLYDGADIVEDEEGKEFDELESARSHAIEALRDLICADAKTGRINIGCHILVEDDQHDVVGRVDGTDAVAIEVVTTAVRPKSPDQYQT
jgi:hypothetical protein